VLRRRSHSLAVAAIGSALAGAVGLAGCGGSGSSSTTASGTGSATAPPSAASTPSSRAATASPPAASTAPSSPTPPNTSTTGYTAQIQNAAKPWVTSAQAYAAGVSDLRDKRLSRTKLAAVARATAAFAAAGDGFARSLAALPPPAGAQQVRNQVVASIKAVDPDLAELAGSARAANLAQAGKDNYKVLVDISNIERNFQSLEAQVRGY